MHFITKQMEPRPNSHSRKQTPNTALAIAQNLESSVDDDGVLKTILSGPRGALSEDGSDWQTRKIGNEQVVPSAHGMKSRQADSGSPGGTIPAKIGAASAPLPKEPN